METSNEKYYDPKGKWSKNEWDNLYRKSDPFNYLHDFNEKIREDIILDYLKWSKHKNVLDVGCGEGTLTKKISLYSEAIDAFDISANAIDFAKTMSDSQNIHYFDLDAADYIASDKKYDLILCSEMIYYLSNQQIIRLFEELRESIRSNGYFILTARSSDYFSIEEIIELLSDHFKVINISPIWRPNKFKHKLVKRICSMFSPSLDRAYKAWLKGLDPKNAFMSCFICLPL